MFACSALAKVVQFSWRWRGATQPIAPSMRAPRKSHQGQGNRPGSFSALQRQRHIRKYFRGKKVCSNFARESHWHDFSFPMELRRTNFHPGQEGLWGTWSQACQQLLSCLCIMNVSNLALLEKMPADQKTKRTGEPQD